MKKANSCQSEEQVLVLMPEGFCNPALLKYSNMLQKMKLKVQALNLTNVDRLPCMIISIFLIIILVLVIILSSQPLCSLSSSPIFGNQESFVIVSDGEVSEYQSTTLGIYDKVDFIFNGYPVFVQRGGQRFVYKGSSEWWYANGNFGAETGVLRTKDLNSTGLSWYYGTGGGWVNNDTSIQIVPLSSPLSHCLECKRVSINSSGGATDNVPEFLGTFDRVEGVYMDGRPVYMNKDGKFFHKDGKATYGVRSKFTGDGVSVQSASGPICAFLEKASKSERFGHGWRFWTGDVWEYDLTLGAVCIQF